MQSVMLGLLDSRLQLIRDSGTWKSERVLVTSHGPSMHNVTHSS